MVGLPPTRVKVLKLHGSTNWFGLFFGGIGGSGFGQFSNVLDETPHFFFRPDFDFLGYSNEIFDPGCKGILESAGLSAMIMPTLRKRFFAPTTEGRHEWEPFWNDIWGQAERALQLSDKIVIIGCSMPREDERARELLLDKSNRTAEVSIYSGSSSGKIHGELRAHGFEQIKAPPDGYFEDYLNA